MMIHVKNVKICTNHLDPTAAMFQHFTPGKPTNPVKQRWKADLHRNRTLAEKQRFFKNEKMQQRPQTMSLKV